MPRTLALALSGVLLAAGLGTAGLSASAAEPVRLLAGTTPATTPFPADTFTVADPAQQTGRRVALPTDGCDAQGRSLCDDLRLIDQLDGFDLQPRVRLPFSGPVDLLSVTPATVYVEGPDGSRTGLVQLVLDPATNSVAGRTDAFLRPQTTYTLVVTPGVKAADGTPVDVGGTARRVPFTTMTATNVLDRARTALDDGSAYTAAGIAATQRTVAFDAVPGMTRSVFPGPTVVNVERQDQTSADPAAPRTTQNAIVAAKSAAYLGFGSIRSPQYTDGNGVIAPVPTTQSPRPVAAAQIGVTMMAGMPGAPGVSCLRPIVFGPGFTRSKFDLFLSGDLLPGRGTAVFATDPLGHNYGPTSTFSVQTTTGTVTGGKAFGRGRDLDGDGLISNSEGVGPQFRYRRNADGTFTPDTPSPDAAVGLRDGLIQTAVDDMALVRALEKGVDVDGDGTVDTCTGKGAVSYYGQSFGGIYGTMLLGADPDVPVGVANVPGGPIVDIARESAFRGNIAAVLQANKPNLLNGGPGLNGFTESVPLRLDPRVTRPLPGAVAIQELAARSDWVSRPGSPETWAARMSAKKVIVQVAYTDGTVPNPTSAQLLRAGGLFDRAWVYRNDRTPTVQTNPHGFLLDPTLAGRNQGQQQVADFLTSDGATQTDPDGPGPVWEKDPALYAVQLDCLHYPDPQTGQQQARTPDSPDCTDRSATLAGSATPTPTGTASAGPTPTATPSGTPTATPTACSNPLGLGCPAPSGTATPTPTSTATGPAPTVSVRPSTTTAGQTARVSGTAAPGQDVQLYAYSRPNTQFRLVRSGTAAADGSFTFDVAPAGSTRLFARTSGGDSASVVLGVRTSINLKVARTGTRTYRFTGSTLPKRSGQLVTVFYARGGGRVIVTRARVAPDGRYAVTRTFSGTGTLTFTTGTGKDNDNEAGTSAPVRVAVR